MGTMTAQSWTLLVVVAVLALLALAAWFFFRRKQSGQLQQRFGLDHGRADGALGGRAAAESELEARVPEGRAS